MFKFGFVGLTEQIKIGEGDYSSVTLRVPPSLTREGFRGMLFVFFYPKTY